MPRHLFQPWEDARIRELYPDLLAETVAEALGLSASQIRRRAHLLGIGKSKAFREREIERIRRLAPGQDGRFQKGMVPWNKGIKGLKSGGMSEETQFKPGRVPFNELPVGAYRITRNGGLQRKIGTAKGSNSKRWRGVHELLWVEANGPVPSGHICVFRPGMSTNRLEEITLDKVECISRAELMKRNTVHNLPPEIVQLVQLSGALKRQINRKKRGAE